MTHRIQRLVFATDASGDSVRAFFPTEEFGLLPASARKQLMAACGVIGE